MATMANDRQRYITQNMSHKYYLKVTKFHCNSFCDLRAVKEHLVGWREHNVPTGLTGLIEFFHKN